jgi:hypothetical protein
MIKHSEHKNTGELLLCHLEATVASDPVPASAFPIEDAVTASPEGPLPIFQAPAFASLPASTIYIMPARCRSMATGHVSDTLCVS